MLLALVSGGFSLPAAVQDVTITETNAYAYSDVNRLVCDSGSKVVVRFSYTLDGKSMKESLIDFIDVTPPAEGQAEPWVSVQLYDAGLTNDVDFSEQPYLWLGADGSADRVLAGTYEPYGDVYRLGYGGSPSGGEKRGLGVPNLGDNPVTGARRSMLVRGTGSVPLASGASFTGGIVVEGPAYFGVSSSGDFGTGVTNRPTDFLTLRNVGGQAARLLLKNQNVTYPATLGIRIEGTNAIHSCGAQKSVTTVLKGPVTGWGRIDLTDQGGIRFASATNTFTGELYMANGHDRYDIEIGIGDGAHCSWAGGAISQRNTTNNIVVVNCDDDFTLNAALSADGGRLVKKGVGNLTLATPFPRRQIRADVPVLQILDGTLTRTQTEPAAASGLMEVADGATLDLNHVAASSLWLPYGGGEILNPADGEVTLTGSANADTRFFGTLDGGAFTVEETGFAAPWRITARTRVNGSLTMATGTVEVGDGFRCSDFAVAKGAHACFASHEDNGLRTEFWYAPGGAWPGATQNDKLEAGIACSETAAAAVTTDMSKFNGEFKSGEASPEGGYSGPFRDILGASMNNFLAKFTGYFIAETGGVYQFRIYADDAARLILDGTNRVVNIATGNANNAGDGSVSLSAGRHPMTLYFLEMSGWEVLKVQMKAPGETDYRVMPVNLLTIWDGRRSDLGAVTGGGSLELAAETSWPTMDLSGFSGTVTVNEQTASSDAGFIAPANADLHFQGGPADFFGTNWWSSGPVATTVVDGRLAVDMGGVKESNAYLNRIKQFDLAKPFTVSFDFSNHAPQASANELGDGFCLMLHDHPSGGYGGKFSYYGSSERINNAGAYGVQCYLMPDQNRIAWVKNNYALGAVATNVAGYTMRNCRDRENPFHVTFSWDLERLVCRFEQEGRAPWATTNTAFAAGDRAEKFPDGTAYLGIWSRNGGYFTTMLYENLTIEEETETAPDETVTLNGVLGVTNGTARILCASGVSPAIASSLVVTGAGGLVAPKGIPVALTNASWTFALTNAAARLTLTGPFTFPADGRITVDLEGEAPLRKRVLADLTAVDGTAADGLAFQLGDGYPGRYRLVYENRRLSISSANGTVVFIR